ncbi:MAG TPA: type II toxin-antitoxin system VapC family toxin [Rhizomicrobium sp.]
MVVDASALLAILFEEPEWNAFSMALRQASTVSLSPINWYEAAINAERYTERDSKALEALIRTIGVRLVPVDETQMRLAYSAWRKYGKGRNRARLNMGDCFAYALAKHLDEPLLYKGSDFVHTDIASAIP